MALIYRGQSYATLKHAPNIPDILQKAGVEENTLLSLALSQAASPKDDPQRRQGLHGPYEELHLMKKGTLPDTYFATGDPEPWSLLVQESRSNLLWQVVSGMLDKQPDFAATYMGLALDLGLSDDDYAKELDSVHKDFRHFMQHASQTQDHHHRSMGDIYRSVSCPACSVLTSLACHDPQMHSLFQDMLPLKPDDRRALLAEKGLAPLLAATVQTGPKPAAP